MSKLYINEANATSVYEILEDEVSIGRGAANQVQLRDPRASKRHAVIRTAQGRAKLIDLESKNGTRVNGAYRNQHWLRQGDTVTVGKAVIRFDAEGAVPAGPVPAVPAAPAVPAPPPLPAAPAAPAAPPAAPARPAAPAASRSRAATRAPSRRSAAAQAPRRPGRGRDRDDYAYDEGEEERQPRYRKKGMDTPVMILIGGLGAILIAAFFFVLMETSTSHNKDVWLRANEIASPDNGSDYAAAIAYGERHGKPGEKDYERLGEDIEKWKGFLEEAKRLVLDQESRKYLNDHITKFTNTSAFRPRYPKSNAEIATLLREFLVKYEGSGPALDIMSEKPGEPWETFRHLLQQHAAGDADVSGILMDARQRANVLKARRRFGDAVRVYEDLKRQQGALLKPEDYATLAKEANKAVLALETEADEIFAAQIEEVESLVNRGKTREARGKLQVIVDEFGIKRLVDQARTRLEELR